MIRSMYSTVIPLCKPPHAPCRYVLKGFSQEGRDLTDDETKAFLKAADKDGDGKIGIDGAWVEGKGHVMTRTGQRILLLVFISRLGFSGFLLVLPI